MDVTNDATDPLRDLPQALLDTVGMNNLIAIWRPNEPARMVSSLRPFLADQANQSGVWLIDGGWGGPPGPIRVRWQDGAWLNDGFPPWQVRHDLAEPVRRTDHDLRS